MNINGISIQQPKTLTNDTNLSAIKPLSKNETSLPKFDKASENVVPFQKGDSVTAEKATNALRNLLQHAHITIDDLEKMPTKNISLMAAAISMKSFGDTAELTIKSLKTMTDAQEFVRNRQVQEFQDQLAKQIQESNKSNVGGILGAIFDWIIGAVEVIVGAFKVLEGAARVAVGDMTGLLSIASGALYVSAGVAGLVKAAAKTAMLAGADKEQCQSVIDVASKVQLGLEMAGLATDIFQCGQAIMATRGIAKGAQEIVPQFAPAMAKAIVTKGGDEILEIGQMIGKSVADDVSQKVMNELMKRTSQQSGEIGQAIQNASKAVISEFRQAGVEYVGKTTQALTKNFSNEAIEQLVTNAVLDFAKTSTKQSAQNLVSLSAEQVAQQMTKAISKNIQMEVAKICVTATSYTGLELVRGSAAAAQEVAIGSINVERAKLMNEINQNGIQHFLMEMVFDTYEKSKDMAKKSLESNYEKYANTLSSTSQLLTDTASLNMKVASNII